MMNLMEGVGTGERSENEQQMQPIAVQEAQLWRQDVGPDLRQHLVRRLWVINGVVSWKYYNLTIMYSYAINQKVLQVWVFVNWNIFLISWVKCLLKAKSVIVTGSWKTVLNHTFINTRNTNYKYSIQYISVTNLAASMQLSINLQLFRVFQFTWIASRIACHFR